MNEQHRRCYQAGCDLINSLYPPDPEKNKKPPKKKKTECQPDGEVGALARNLDDMNIEKTEKKKEKPIVLILFENAKLHPNLLNATQNLRFITANEVQTRVLTFFSEKFEAGLKICAPRKCGKTTAVVLCIVNELLNKVVEKKFGQSLILCPTIELAEMCYLWAQQFTKFSPLSSCLAIKGKTFKKIEKINENIIVATPDKALNIIRYLDLKKIKHLFIDDADCLKNPTSHFNIFIQLSKKLSRKCQIIATTNLESEIFQNFFEQHVKYYQYIKVEDKPANYNYENIKQLYVVYNFRNKEEIYDAIVHFLTKSSNFGQTVIFCEITEDVILVDELFKSKRIRGVKLFGGLSATERSDVLKEFKNNEIEILITTPAFLHVLPCDHIAHVINLEQLYNKSDGLLLEEYERRRYLLNKKETGTFINFVDERYRAFFFSKKESVVGDKICYEGAEIITVENFKYSLRFPLSFENP